jgi:cellulose synthase/poly-beta-1,6-N-acetylglucosamine synthase-like glycosyltransferase
MSLGWLEPLWPLVVGFNLLVLVYFLTLNSVYLLTSLFAFRALRRYALRLKSLAVDDLLGDGVLPPVTVLAPAYNEAANCVESVRALLGLRYPDYEVLFINDGSTDGTLEKLSEAFDLRRMPRAPTADVPTAEVRGVYRSTTHPRLWVVDKVNGGKADALNAGLSLCRTPLFCAIDADTLIERDALTRISRPFLEDARTVAAGGIIRIANGSTVESGRVTNIRLPGKLLARFQVLEYLRAFLSGRMGWDALDSTLVISGAFGMFRRSTVVAAGGYARDTVGEDMELVVRLHRHCRENRIPYGVRFVPDPVAWTECPESLRVLGRQRDRWQRGLIESMWRHRVMLFNPRYGRVGFLAYPYFFFLEMIGPVVEALGYFAFILTILLGRASALYVIAFLLLAVVFGIALSVAAVALEELSFRRYTKGRDLVVLLGLSFVETIGYRQLNTWWRFRGVISKLRGVRTWGVMDRQGFETAASGSASGATPSPSGRSE